MLENTELSMSKAKTQWKARYLTKSQLFCGHKTKARKIEENSVKWQIGE